MAQTNRQVLDALRKKLGNVSHQAIQQRRAKLQKLVPMPTDIATYIVAHRAGVPINRWLDESTLATVASFESQVAAKEGTAPAQIRTAPATKGTKGAREVTLFPGIPTARLSAKHMRDAERMAKVYPLLYVFENSAREFIDGHLAQKYGDWWDDPKIVPTDVRRTVEISRKAEAENRTHTSRKARPIYYTTFGDLVRIVESEKGRTVFKKPLFPRPTWFTELVKASEHTRNIVAHMNPLQPADVRRLEMALQDWLKQTAGHEPPPVE
ncbi:MAG: Swt1 family HEPN domain-containing protein [Actinomycetota bacterium]